MPAPILNISATVLCSHGGRVILLPNSRLLVGGAPAALYAPVLPIAGCTVLTNDVSVPVIAPSITTRVTSNGMPLLLQTFMGMGIASGSPVTCISPGQMKVTAT